MTQPTSRTWAIAPDDVQARGALRPDGRWLLWLPQGREPDWPALVQQIVTDLDADLLVITTDQVHDAGVWALESAGFTPSRVELVWQVPVPRLARGARGVEHELLPVDRLDPADVAALDNDIRADIPGSEQWQGTAEQLLENLTDVEFDPAMYLIARHRTTGSLDGLVRVWNHDPIPRVGCVGVRREWRRTRLAASLIGAVADELARRGVSQVSTETDQLNRDSAGMARRAGGTVVATTTEWLRTRG